MKTKFTLTFIAAILIFGCLTGCGGTKITDDLVKKYSDYWDYALGSYSYDCEWTDDNGGGSGGLTWTEYKVFEFHYTDDAGNAKSFKINNYNEEDGISYVCSDILEEELSDEIEARNFESLGVAAHISSMAELKDPHVSVDKIDRSISYLDASRGINIKGLSLKNLSANNLRATINFPIFLTEAEEYPGLQTDLTDMASFIFHIYDYDSITVSFYIYDLNSHYLTSYYLTCDGLHNTLSAEG